MQEAKEIAAENAYEYSAHPLEVRVNVISVIKCSHVAYFY